MIGTLNFANDVMSAGRPKRWGTITARVRAVVLLRAPRGSMLSVYGSMSAGIGVAPMYRKAFSSALHT